MIAALRAPSVRRACRALVIGEPAVWKRAGWTPALAPLVNTKLGLKAPAYGKPSALTGRASFAALEQALRLAQRRLVDGLVTAPISKAAWKAAGVKFTDHTEYLKEELRPKNVQMLLGSPAKRLWTVTTTRHIPLRAVPNALSVKSVVAAASALRDGLKLLGIRDPRIALSGLNPHAGEQGILGSEEKRVLIPAARAAKIAGPIPADTAWRHHIAGHYDGLVCLYHDQALIGLKSAAGLGIVNWTIGLPFPRTSPGHGAGFDIAGKREPDATGMIDAALLAALLA